jgi:hypothetical protein
MTNRGEPQVVGIVGGDGLSYEGRVIQHKWLTLAAWVKGGEVEKLSPALHGFIKSQGFMSLGRLRARGGPVSVR